MISATIYYEREWKSLINDTKKVNTIEKLTFKRVNLRGVSLGIFPNLKTLGLDFITLCSDFKIDSPITSPITSLIIYSCENLFNLSFPSSLVSLSISFSTFDEKMLNGLTNLKNIFVKHCIAFANPCKVLGTLTSLESLSLHGTLVDSLTNLAPCVNIKHLDISDIEFPDLSFTEGWDLLSFSSYSCMIRDLSMLNKMKNIEYIDLGADSRRHMTKVRITSFDFLKGLKNIKTLTLKYFKLEDISFLCELTSLEKLCLRENHIVDVEPLTALINLKELDLNSNRIYDATPLAVMPLQKLVLSNNCIMMMTKFCVPQEGLCILGNYTADGIRTYEDIKGRYRRESIVNIDNKEVRYAYKAVLKHLAKTNKPEQSHDFSMLSEASRSIIEEMYKHRSFKYMFDIIWPLIYNHKHASTIVDILNDELLRNSCNTKKEYTVLGLALDFLGLPVPINYRIVLDNIILDSQIKHPNLTGEQRYQLIKPAFDEAFRVYQETSARYD